MKNYGRGKFQAHPNYIQYMEDIVRSESFKGMPNAESNGRINWQVSSGKSTSFYKYYLERWKWWDEKATEVGLPGTGNENERFTITARLINPTGYRACRLCGEDWNVGYYYINVRFYKILSNRFPRCSFFKWQPIDSVIHELKKVLTPDELLENLLAYFPSRKPFFDSYGVSKEAFEKSSHVNTKSLLTPGYMGNPPDRLDGFHDYHFECRKNNDPGRFDANMKTYTHDRRSFEYWAEGNWMIADTLYNLAGIGHCHDCNTESEVIKISPDHIGPLSCGFKQMPFYKPLCSTHNSAKNRRFTFYDTQLLIRQERKSGESVASFQIKAHWDKHKLRITNDQESKILSSSLRALQDAYFRILILLWKHGYVRFICTLLSPHFAFDDVSFTQLDASKLTFLECLVEKKITPNRKSLFTRSVRIALSSLQEYVWKESDTRKLVRKDYENNEKAIQRLLKRFSEIEYSSLDEQWSSTIPFDRQLGDFFDEKIVFLTDAEEIPKTATDLKRFSLLHECLDEIGSDAIIEL
jgi:Alw26I/Eco31I/Esp3I family type II restriction endonuclease